ncbi:galectin-5-like [Sardina pilchardus]|uniref:galectin-5-like n=1 Tax=Sardina pilchardus TaxID=27697 RepID=UPI002E0F8EEC
MDLADALTGCPGHQGNGMWPAQPCPQPGQPCWPCPPNPNYPNYPPTAWPAPTQPAQPTWPMPHPQQQPTAPTQPAQPAWPMPPPAQPRYIPGGASTSGWPINPGQPGWPGQPAPVPVPVWPGPTPVGPVGVPYNLNFPRGVYDKLMLTITGQVKPMAKMFTVNFLRGNDIALHINPRFNEGGKQILVRNHRQGERWGREERNIQGPFPFAPGQPFEMKILVTYNEFKVAVNGAQVFEFKHRIRELNQIDRLNILQDINLTSINLNTMP